MDVAAYCDALSRNHRNIHHCLLLLENVANLVQDLIDVLLVQLLFRLKPEKKLIHEFLRHYPILKTGPRVRRLDFDRVRVNLSGWSPVIHPDGCFELLLPDRLLTLIQLAASVFVRRLNFHGLSEVSSSLLQFVKGEVSRSSPVVALDVRGIQRDCLGSVDDGTSVVLKFDMAEGAVCVENVIALVELDGFGVEVDSFLEVTLLEFLVCLCFDLLRFCELLWRWLGLLRGEGDNSGSV
mmetsp:Transcript_34101/g.106764  ORF Transcript_34101/g.106764 Transcript_34101/m.106764 type:complete len:238 (+) Transcript_34101:965-1678(+)